jgi:hypothetical protein
MIRVNPIGEAGAEYTLRASPCTMTEFQPSPVMMGRRYSILFLEGVNHPRNLSYQGVRDVN